MQLSLNINRFFNRQCGDACELGHPWSLLNQMSMSETRLRMHLVTASQAGPLLAEDGENPEIVSSLSLHIPGQSYGLHFKKFVMRRNLCLKRQLEKENMTLMKALAHRNKIIELSGVEFQKLRINLRNVQEKNLQLARSLIQTETEYAFLELKFVFYFSLQELKSNRDRVCFFWN
ncbi:Uncharacterized protein Rs2_13210 [Raphanus sativus]|nr:Uncharacterized protein Rs2_13210 [Raphanus sativus]